jgi:hypothetical protein
MSYLVSDEENMLSTIPINIVPLKQFQIKYYQGNFETAFTDHTSIGSATPTHEGRYCYIGNPTLPEDLRDKERW